MNRGVCNSTRKKHEDDKQHLDTMLLWGGFDS